MPGFEFEGHQFLPVRAPVPSVNGNWTHRTRRLLEKGMGYREFGTWAAANRIGIYVPHAFSELLGDKLETYKLVRGFHETLHPHCEPWERSAEQLEYFVETGGLCFIKPRAGSKGDNIITVRREDSGLIATRYYKGSRREIRAARLDELLEFIRPAISRKRKYVIQHGIETMRYHGSTFDVRVTMLHDGSAWHWLHEARLSRAGSDVSNVAQGGSITPTEDLLFELVGIEAAGHLLRQLESESFGLAAYLGQLHPGEILEVAFDFAVDQEGGLRLLEINTKPGLAGIGSNISVHDKRPEHEPAFERWVYPHAKYLASFLLNKAAVPKA
ncbi:MAG: YheC/YheD family protein [Planctomycetota bacterium]